MVLAYKVRQARCWLCGLSAWWAGLAPDEGKAGQVLAGGLVSELANHSEGGVGPGAGSSPRGWGAMVYSPWKVLRAGNGRVGQVLVWRWEGQVLTLGTSL